MEIRREKTTCRSCGFSAYYEFINCPECDAEHDLGRPLFADKPEKRLVFPFPSVRPVQQKMMDDVTAALESGSHLVADAPTGLGKTAAVLFPALQYALDSGKTVFFLTSRLSQHRAAVETLKMLRRSGDFKAVDIIGKKHLCSQEVADMDSGMFSNFCQALVKEKQCKFYTNSSALNTAADRDGIVRILSTQISSPEESMKIASARYCTYEILMDAARRADVVVGDYFHLFGMGDRFLKRMGKNISDSVIIVDEAHNLSSRLRDYMSATLTTRSCKLAAKEAEKFGAGEVSDMASGVSSALTSLAKKSLVGKNESFILREEFIDRINAADSYDVIIERMTELGRRVLEDRKTSHSDRVAGFLHAWKKGDLGYARILSRQRIHNEDNIALQFSCLDPSLISRDIISSSHSTILMSGTLRPMEMHRDLLGLDAARTTMKSYESPFHSRNRLNIIVRGVTTKYTERTPEKLRQLAAKISLWIDSISGNTAVFFPSYLLRDSVCDMIRTKKHAILEKSSMTKADRDAVKEEMRHHSGSGAVLFAVMGGSFSEGIDLPGDLLQGVIIVGLPLERPDLSVTALIDYYDKRFNRGRDYGYNFPAMIKSMQAAGRCIRTETDRGVIVFADERFLWDNYRKMFPKDLEFTITSTPDREITKFFNGQ